MDWRVWMQYLLFFGALLALTPFLGRYIADVFSQRTPAAQAALGWLEHLCYRVANVRPEKEMSWTAYARAVLLFNCCGFLFLFLLLLMQGFLPLNPQNFEGLPLSLAFNTAMSFVTNTDWQSYAGETTLSYTSQMLGLTPQNFLSAATGMAVAMALIRGLTRRNSSTIGNFWSDLTRSIVYIFLPLAVIMALFLVSQGTIQNFSSYLEITTLENAQQVVPLGPVASQAAIKMLGTNGGGFFNANGAHPFENPNQATNFVSAIAILLIPAAMIYAYGILIQARKHALQLLLVCFSILFLGIFAATYSEHLFNPVLQAYPLMEGKETRLGMGNTLLWTISTTAAANGSVNAMLSSLSPIAGAVALLNMLIGECIFGGVGVGLCSLLMFTLLTVFIAGLMVGRTPEYLGKKIEKGEIRWVVMTILLPGALILIGAGFSSFSETALASLGNQGPHGLTEIVYAFTSAAANNGSAFAGLNANTNYYNWSLGIVMFFGRLAILLPSLAIAGLLAKKKTSPATIGTFSTDGFLFAGLLFGIILIVGALSFFPVISLGPVVEQLLMLEGRSF